MADFDFDELDRAVAGALNTTSPSAAQPAPPATELSSSMSQSEVTTSSPSTPPPAARRSTGRFMDMVHPASDMRGSRPDSSQGTEVKPVTQSTDTPPPADPFTSSFEELPSKNDETAKPLESPFLPDAKVEKRPLGGVGIFPPETSPQPEAAPFVPTEPGELPPDTSDQHTMPDPIDFALQNQPEEEVKMKEAPQPEAPKEAPLSSEIPVPSELSEKPFVDAEPAQLEEQLANIEAETVELPSEIDTTHPRDEESIVVPATETEPVSAEVEPKGPTSITQQYQEQPSSTVESGAIFDTEAYHQPLVHHAAKKKSGIWVIVWILVLVIAGAGAGVAFYLYILPTL